MKKGNDAQIQQGDVWFEAAQIPDGAQPVTGHVFAEGEGHHEHMTTPDAVKLFEFDGKKYARFLKPTKIRHTRKGSLDGGEHGALEVLVPGDYEYGQVLEYDYVNEMARVVVD